MKNKKIIMLTISILMVLLVPIILYLFNFNIIAFNENFYKKEFARYDVYSTLNEHDIEKINSDVLNYLENERENKLINNDFFNYREQAHLLDVKNLIQKTLVIYYTSVILFILLFIVLIILLDFNIKKIAKRFLLILFFGSALTLIDAFLFFLLSNINFDFLFRFFHKTFFPVGTFTFNPEFEDIVVLYPEKLFFDALIKIITKTILSSVILTFLSFIVLFYYFKIVFSNFLPLKYRRRSH